MLFFWVFRITIWVSHLVCFSLTLTELHEQNLIIVFSSMIWDDPKRNRDIWPSVQRIIQSVTMIWDDPKNHTISDAWFEMIQRATGTSDVLYKESYNQWRMIWDDPKNHTISDAWFEMIQRATGTSDRLYKESYNQWRMIWDDPKNHTISDAWFEMIQRATGTSDVLYKESHTQWHLHDLHLISCMEILQKLICILHHNFIVHNLLASLFYIHIKFLQWLQYSKMTDMAVTLVCIIFAELNPILVSY